MENHKEETNEQRLLLLCLAEQHSDLDKYLYSLRKSKKMDDTTDIDFSTSIAENSKIIPSTYTEKCDISPEYFEKSSSDTKLFDHKPSTLDEILPNRKINVVSNKSDERDIEGTVVQNKNTGFAFTIDFGEGKTVDKRKLKEMTEHFQNRQLRQQEKQRHRRGVSLSKLEDCRKSSISLNNLGSSLTTVDDSGVMAVTNKPPFKHRSTRSDHAKGDGRVALRMSRPIATNETKQDSMKRHSWSPRSSLNSEKSIQISYPQVSSDQVLKYIENIGSFQPKSTTLQRTLTSNDSSKSKTYNSLITESTVDYVVTTPLEYVRSSDEESSIGDVSQATYTLDGDNYTEEEKERMSIDKFNRSDFNLSIDSLLTRGLTQKNLSNKSFCEAKGSNTHSQRSSTEKEQLPKQKSAKFYLDKIKARVKSIGDRKSQNNIKKELLSDKSMCSQFIYTDKSSENELDHGTFTR